MNEFMDLVICKLDSNSHLSIFSAPAWSNLQKGDRVLVETKNNRKLEAIVEKSYTVDVTNKDAFEFILMAGGVSLPLKKVLQKVMFIDLNYKDGKHE